MKLPHLDFSSTLDLKFPFGQTFALAILIFALLVGGLETAARLLLDDAGVPTATGSDNPVADVKFGILDRLVAQNGKIDCIFLGSSVVLDGFDPPVFSDTYGAKTGQPLVCYNFGIPALTARTAGLLAEVLVKRYHPRLLMYGLTAREVADNASEAKRVYRDITGTPWIAYRRGSFSVDGWLTEYSSAYRHYLAYRNWMQPDFIFQLHQFTRAPSYGYQPFLATRPFEPDKIPAPRFFKEFVQSPIDAAGLKQLIALQGQTQVLMVEMPLPDFMRAMFNGGSEAYTRLLEEWGQYAAEQGVPLWMTSTLELVPMDGWAEDGFHVNAKGADLLSRWLGEQVGTAVSEGRLNTP